MRRVNEQCVNGLHFCVQILSDMEMHQLLSGMTEVLAPLTVLHNEQSHRLRSFKEARAWYTELSLGSGFKVLNEVVLKLSSQTVLEAARLYHTGSCPHGLQWAALRPDHPLVAAQDSVAEHLGKLVVSVLKYVGRSLLWHDLAWPGGFAGLLDPAAAPAILQRMRVDWETWYEVQEQNSALWRAKRKKSCFNLMVVQKVFRIASAADWQATPALLNVVRALFETFGQSNVIELGVNVSKKSSEASHTRRMADARRWMSLIESSVAEGWFNYTQLPGWENEVVPRGLLRGRSLPDFFATSDTAASTSFRDVVGTGPPTWTSLAPKMDIQMAADLALARDCAKTDTWSDASKLWLSCLIPDTTFLVRKISTNPDAPWFWRMGEAAVSGKLGWPAKETRAKQQVFWTVLHEVASGDLEWIMITDVTEWEAIRVRFVSPLGLALRCGSGGFLPHPSIMALPMCAPQPLLQCAARNTFWKLPKTALIQMTPRIS